MYTHLQTRGTVRSRLPKPSIPDSYNAILVKNNSEHQTATIFVTSHIALMCRVLPASSPGYYLRTVFPFLQAGHEEVVSILNNAEGRIEEWEACQRAQEFAAQRYRAALHYGIRRPNWFEKESHNDGEELRDKRMSSVVYVNAERDDDISQYPQTQNPHAVSCISEGGLRYRPKRVIPSKAYYWYQRWEVRRGSS